MKNPITFKLITSLSFLLFYSLSSYSQGEWQWARSFSGQDDPINSGLYNQITRSVYDSQGNIYIAGTMGENAFLDNDEALSEGFMAGWSSVLLAKFDPQGNFLWKKSIKNSEYESYTNWMEIVGDTAIVLLAESYSPGGNNGYKLWYLDTLIRGQYPNPPTYPLNGGSFSCFVTFDLDGNKQSEYFLRTTYFTTTEPIHVSGGGLAYNQISPFHIDNNGNVYMYVNIGKPTNADTMRISINDQKVFPLGDYSIKNNAWLLKFTPDFDLIWSKQMIRDTSGTGSEDSSLSWLYPYPTGITVDEEENMYLTGYIKHLTSDDTSYYRELDLGSGKKLIMNDAGCDYLGFIIKYDTTGEPVWANQVFGKKKFNIGNTSSSYTTTISTSTINGDNNCVYISGNAFHSLTYLLNGHSVFDSTICKLYFDDSTQLRFEPDTASGTPKASGLFFAKLNKETGKYISHGVSDGVFNQRQSENSIVARNNQVIKEIMYGHHLKGIDTIYYTGGVTYPGFAIVRWKDDGELIEVNNIPVYANSGKTRSGNTIMNDKGELFITGMFSNNISFGDITLNGSSRSNAFLAKYTDTTFLHPYLSSIEDIAIENSNNLIIYPNPAYNEVNIKIRGERIIDFSLYNMNGQLIFKKDSPKAKTEKLSLFLLPKGVYLLKVKTDKNVYSRKVIRN